MNDLEFAPLPGSPLDPEERAYLDAFEWSEEKLEDYAKRARTILLALGGVERPVVNSAGEGACDDCHREGPRDSYGCFDLCGECIDARVREAAELDAEP